MAELLEEVILFSLVTYIPLVLGVRWLSNFLQSVSGFTITIHFMVLISSIIIGYHLAKLHRGGGSD